LKVAYYIHGESVVVGNTTNLVISGSLFCHKERADLRLLKNINLELETKSYTDDNPVKRNFENLSLENDKETVIQF